MENSKQYVVAGSNIESEYVTHNDATKEAVWMQKFIKDLGLIPFDWRSNTHVLWKQCSNVDF